MNTKAKGFRDLVQAELGEDEMRPPLREEPRTEDPRAAAKKRAAEIRGHLGNLDEGTDDFWVDPAVIPEGWTYEWKTHTIYNAEDPTYTTALQRAGWTPVPASRHPEMMPRGAKDLTILRKGMMLMERPKEITEEIRQIELRRARAQVRVKEEQLSAAPPGQFERANKDNPLVKVKKGYEPMPIPDE